MKFSESSAILKKFRRTPWRFQTTLVTPFKNLGLFVNTLLSADPSIQTGSIAIDQVVFDPRALKALLFKHLITAQPVLRDISLKAETREEVAELLEATLSGGIDFLFVPEPKSFVAYADHDEYITVYANTKSNLNRVVEPLASKNFKRVPNYVRPLRR